MKTGFPCAHILTRKILFSIQIFSLHALCHVSISSFVSVENEHSDAVCIDRLQFYGTPKFAIEATPFATCNLPAHTWAESSQVYKYSLGTYSYVPTMTGRVQSRFEFDFGHSEGCSRTLISHNTANPLPV